MAGHLRGVLDVPGCVAPTVLAVKGREALGRAFAYTVDLTAESLELEALVGAEACVTLIDENGRERFVRGVVDAVDLGGSATAELLRARLHVVPRHCALRHRHGFRIFQEMSVPEIVTQLFEDAGLPAELLRWDTSAEYASRTYCVQYDETEWDFACRLLEDEGIWFAFEHEVDATVMVFADASDRAPELDPALLRFRTQTESSRAPAYDEPLLTLWRRTRRLVEAKVHLRDYDGLRPSLDLGADAEHAEPEAREHYEYPGGHETASDGARRAQLRLEELASRRRTVLARCDWVTVLPGRRFELLDHPSDSGEFVVTAVRLCAVMLEEPGTTQLPLPEPGESRVELECVPREQLFRTARTTPRPRVYGVQTARVTGPSGEEIHCDEHGRVKVQFHWDLDGELDERTSCWIRSTHAHTTGSVTIPRVGWEVLVQFYEGDPDRPVVLGHLFNSLHRPPVELPAKKTVTAHRTVASPGAGAVNEVFFDDASGSQQIAINAGRDMTIHTVENKTFQVTQNSKREVTSNRSAEVGADERISLEANHGDNIGGDQTISIGANRNVKVSGDASDAVAASTTVTVGGLENMMIGNPIDAVLDIIADQALAAAQGAAASAASRVEGALLGPVQPALGALQGALGSASELAGPAQAILGAENPAAALYGDALKGISEATTPPDVAGMASGMANAVANDALSSVGLGGGGGGSGLWETLVGGDMSESIGALGAINSVQSLTFNVGGSSTETIGAARALLVKGGYKESCASKSETVGVYLAKVGEAFAVDAKAAITLTTASCDWNLQKGYAAAAQAICAVTASTVSLDAKETVTLKCGSAEVIIDKSGIGCKGAISVTIEASGTLELKPPAIGPG